MEMRHKDTNERLEALAYEVIGAAIEVHSQIGPGFSESVYHNALAYELELRGIGYETEKQVLVVFKGRRVGEGFIDLLVDEQLVIELKAVEELNRTHKAQVASYLKAAGLRLGLLINFNRAVLKDGIQRVLNA